MTTTAPTANRPVLLAGYPDRYPSVYHRIRTVMGDMTIVIDFGEGELICIVRNIEKSRVTAAGCAREVWCPEDLVPADELHENRNVAFAQATARYLVKRGINEVVSDQMLPLLIADVLREHGIHVTCDRQLGILERRQKDAWEIERLADAQSATEDAIHFAFEVIRDADSRDGILVSNGQPLTSESLSSQVAMYLLERNYSMPGGMIAAGGVHGANCHDRGSGPLRPNETIILDVFPISGASRYSGDCTRTLVRGDIDERIAELHAAVVEAKRNAIAACRPGATGAEVHEAACHVFVERGYHIGLPPENAPDDLIFYPHGTGHGIGLETHEPPLLDEKNHEPLVVGDALTVEPGLYCRSFGGIRIEDLVIVTEDGSRNLNTKLPESLWWG